MVLESQPYGALGTGPPPLSVRASFLRRLAAVLIDGLIVGAVTGLVSGVIATAMGEGGGRILQLLVTIASWAYYIYFWHQYGATPGKMALGLRVVNDHGQFPTWGQAIGRFFAEILSAIPFFLGYFWALGEQRRTWHDLLAGTYVIHQQQ